MVHVFFLSKSNTTYTLEVFSIMVELTYGIINPLMIAFATA